MDREIRRSAPWRHCATRWPGVTLLLAAATTLLQIWPDVAARLSYDRVAIAAGEVWRLFTGHLTHWNSDHLAWDALMFALLGAIVERRDRACFWATLGAAPLAISAAVWLLQPGVEQYRGLSGVDSALFALVALIVYDEMRRARQTTAAWALVALAVGFIGKTFWELATGATLFVDSARAGFTPLPLAHVVGACAGALVWLGRTQWKAMPSRYLGAAPCQLGGNRIVEVATKTFSLGPHSVRVPTSRLSFGFHSREERPLTPILQTGLPLNKPCGSIGS